MASNKLEGGKCKGGGDVKAGLRHNDCSPEMRKIAAKGNPDIDPAKSHLNVNLTGDTYPERCRKYDARIEELDAMPGANKRKDRVTGQKIETPVPAGIPREQYNAFLSRVLDIQREMFGAENLVSADIHWDEEHEYTDPKTKQPVMSRVHLQSIFIPVKDGKLNGQAIYNRRTMRELNKACQEMALNEFGVDFLTGEGKSSESIAELKAKSKAAAIIAQAEKDAVAIRLAAQAELAQQRQAQDQEFAKIRNTIMRVREDVEAREARVQQQEQAIEARQAALAAREASIPRLAAEAAQKAAEAEIEAAGRERRRPLRSNVQNGAAQRMQEQINRATAFAERSEAQRQRTQGKQLGG